MAVRALWMVDTEDRWTAEGQGADRRSRCACHSMTHFAAIVSLLYRLKGCHFEDLVVHCNHRAYGRWASHGQRVPHKLLPPGRSEIGPPS